jgi:hypothetical protein
MSVKMASSTLHPATIKGANQPVETISGYIPADPQKDKQLVYALDLLHGSVSRPAIVPIPDAK